MKMKTFSTLYFAMSLSVWLCLPRPAAAAPPNPVSFDQYIRESAVPKKQIDRFLRGPSWAQFDPELGYIMGNYMTADGMDHSATISTVQPDGARTSFVYAGRKCRINAYGDSFTHCDQVSDAETWEEHLAGHLGEPIRNFGVGGYGVYQAYRRMIREERTDHAAEYLIFYIWGDDHIRSLLRCRHANTYKWSSDGDGSRFHCNFWANLEMDPETGNWIEKENPLPTPAALYHMSEPDWLVEHLKDDLALELNAFKDGNIRDLDRKQISKLAARLDFPFDWNKESSLRSQAGALLDRYSLRATQFVLKKARTFARENGKKLMVVLFDPDRALPQLRDGGKRYDQEIVDYLTRENFTYFDMNEVQLRDFKKFNLTYQEYKKRFFVGGHYNPYGYNFFAYSIKDKVVDWLDPKPITYRKIDLDSTDFRSYLQP